MATRRFLNEDELSQWAQGPSKTEQQRCENAEVAIRNAVARSDKLKSRSIKVFTHGSYRNRVNVRRESDIDIGVLCRDTFFYALPDGGALSDYGCGPATYHFSQFKDELGEALVAYFGQAAVTRGNKAFDVKENTYHVEADVAPFFEYRDYRRGNPLEGVELLPDSGGAVINWPEQHYSNGVAKNDVTLRAFKGSVRILKHVAVFLDDEGISGSVPGFLVECMAYNVPNTAFLETTWRGRLTSALAHIYQATSNDDACAKWVEVSELKWLFTNDQKWTRQQANLFAVSAWQFLGLG